MKSGLVMVSLLIATLFVSDYARAQTNASLPSVLTNIAQVRALGPGRAQQLRQPVHVRGVVTYMNSQRTHFFLQDATAGMLIPVADTNLCPPFGMDVEVVGTTGNDGVHWGIMQGRFIIHGPGKLPTPIKATLAEVQANRHSSQWVEVEGIVLQVRTYRSQYIVLQLADISGIASVSLTAFPDQLSATNAIGARIRAQGLNVRAEQAPVLTPDPMLATVLTIGRRQLLDAPATDVAGLRAAGASLDPVTIQGTVLRTIYKPSREYGVYIRDDTGALQTVMLPPQSTNDGGYVDPRPGDVVVVAGCPTAVQPNVYLQHAQMRLLQAGPEPEPFSATLADVVGGKPVSDLVTVRGRLLARHEIATGRNRWRDVLRLAADGHEVNVLLESNTAGKFAALSVNDLLEARGIVVPGESTAFGSPAKEFLVQVGSAADVHSLGLAPEITRWRTLRLAAGGAVLTLLAGSWIALLRGRLARERRVTIERERSEVAIREANASLERRVTERTIELEKAREETARALATERELNALKTRFVSIVSHEFRTPLGIVMSAVELLRNYQERLSAVKRDELHADIYNSTRQMAGLMEQVLVLGRVEGGKLAFKPAPVDVPALCQKLADEAASVTAGHCPIIVRCDGSLAGAQGDEALVRHIFSNLLSNAVKYSKADGKVDFMARREGGNVVFTVSDHGIGIPEADLPKLFEAFRRASNVGEVPGTGLGMLIVKRCIELQNGGIEIQSKVDQGTTVIVTLPMFAAH